MASHFGPKRYQRQRGQDMRPPRCRCKCASLLSLTGPTSSVATSDRHRFRPRSASTRGAAVRFSWYFRACGRPRGAAWVVEFNRARPAVAGCGGWAARRRIHQRTNGTAAPAAPLPAPSKCCLLRFGGIAGPGATRATGWPPRNRARRKQHTRANPPEGQAPAASGKPRHPRPTSHAQGRQVGVCRCRGQTRDPPGDPLSPPPPTPNNWSWPCVPLVPAACRSAVPLLCRTAGAMYLPGQWAGEHPAGSMAPGPPRAWQYLTTPPAWSTAANAWERHWRHTPGKNVASASAHIGGQHTKAARRRTRSGTDRVLQTHNQRHCTLAGMARPPRHMHDQIVRNTSKAEGRWKCCTNLATRVPDHDRGTTCGRKGANLARTWKLPEHAEHLARTM